MRELSSPFTFFYKYIFIFIWFFGFGFGIGDTLSTLEPLTTKWNQYMALWLGVTVFIFFTSGNIKKVVIDGDELIITNFLKTDRMPLSRISGVDGSNFLSPRLVWLTLHEPSLFGTRIVFLPKHRLTKGLGKHPIVHELIEELRLEN